MQKPISSRLLAFVDALPILPGMRVLEIGCGPGAAARELSRRLGRGHVLAIDRSAKAISQARACSRVECATGHLEFRHVAIEDFELSPGEAQYDLAFAIRVGALDGRHPHAGEVARARIRAALVAGGRLYIDGGDPLREVNLNPAIPEASRLTRVLSDSPLGFLGTGQFTGIPTDAFMLKVLML